MSISLPDESTANAESNAATAAQIAAAEAEFIASTTVAINQAIGLGQFFVEPILPPLVTSAYVTTYFTGIGYTVVFPIIPPGPYNAPVYIPGCVPPGYIPPNTPMQPGPVRIQISWPNP
jgi:hypothetical protein